MKTWPSRNIDIPYWQNTPNRNILYQYNETIWYEWNTHICTSAVCNVLLFFRLGFLSAQSERASLTPLGFLAGT